MSKYWEWKKAREAYGKITIDLSALKAVCRDLDQLPTITATEQFQIDRARTTKYGVPAKGKTNKARAGRATRVKSPHQLCGWDGQSCYCGGHHADRCPGRHAANSITPKIERTYITKTIALDTICHKGWERSIDDTDTMYYVRERKNKSKEIVQS